MKEPGQTLDIWHHSLFKAEPNSETHAHTRWNGETFSDLDISYNRSLFCNMEKTVNITLENIKLSLALHPEALVNTSRVVNF